MRYFRTFVVAAPILGFFYHFVTREPMPWWPDTAIMAVFMGGFAVFVRLMLVIQFGWGGALLRARRPRR